MAAGSTARRISHARCVVPAEMYDDFLRARRMRFSGVRLINMKQGWRTRCLLSVVIDRCLPAATQASLQANCWLSRANVRSAVPVAHVLCVAQQVRLLHILETPSWQVISFMIICMQEHTAASSGLTFRNLSRCAVESVKSEVRSPNTSVTVPSGACMSCYVSWRQFALLRAPSSVHAKACSRYLQSQ